MTGSVANNHLRKAQNIAHDIRQQIVSGTYRTGHRLPTRAELTAAYGVSNLTVQRALDRLRRDGFVVTEGRRGTFVAADPPHLTNYALLFPEPLAGNRTDNLFWHALHVSALEWDEPGVEFSVYAGFMGREGFDDYDMLLDDVQHDRVAGLIFASPPASLKGTPLLTRPGVPRVGMGGPFSDRMVSIKPDSESFVARSVQCLGERGRRRIAVLLTDKTPVATCEQYIARMRESGIELRPDWIQASSLAHPEWAARLVPLLFRGGAETRPDGLIIADDNLTEPVTRALHELGLAAPDDVCIVSHCNFPLSLASHLPVIRLGFDQSLALRHAINAITAMRAGASPEMRVCLPAVFDGEIDRT